MDLLETFMQLLFLYRDFQLHVHRARGYHAYYAYYEVRALDDSRSLAYLMFSTFTAAASVFLHPNPNINPITDSSYGDILRFSTAADVGFFLLMFYRPFDPNAIGLLMFTFYYEWVFFFALMAKLFGAGIMPLICIFTIANSIGTIFAFLAYLLPQNVRRRITPRLFAEMHLILILVVYMVVAPDLGELISAELIYKIPLAAHVCKQLKLRKILLPQFMF